MILYVKLRKRWTSFISRHSSLVSMLRWCYKVLELAEGFDVGGRSLSATEKELLAGVEFPLQYGSSAMSTALVK